MATCGMPITQDIIHSSSSGTRTHQGKQHIFPLCRSASLWQLRPEANSLDWRQKTIEISLLDMDAQIDPTNENSHRILDGKRRRRYFQVPTSSSFYLTSMAALTVAASYLWASPASAFTSITPRNYWEKSSAQIHAATSHQHYGQRTHLCLKEENVRPVGSSTCLFLAAASPNNDKEEWRAILAAFQLYKAAYGDLKIPTRFVVPSMKPWPGMYLS